MGCGFLSSVFLRTWVQQQQLKLEKQEQQRSRKASSDLKVPPSLPPVFAAVFCCLFFFRGCWGSLPVVLCGFRDIYLCSEKKIRGFDIATPSRSFGTL